MKPEPDADVEMKADEPAKNGDAPPINDGKASTSRLARKPEPSYEIKPNFSRVTPAQLQHISFPNDGRYQLVRPVSSKLGSQRKNSVGGLLSEGCVGGGGILILADLRPGDEAELIEFEPPTPPAAIVQATAPPTTVANGNAVRAAPSGPHISLDENAPEAGPPESFEVCFSPHGRIYVDPLHN